MILKSCNFTELTDQVICDTRRLREGLYLQSINVPPNTKITSIIDSNTIEISQNALNTDVENDVPFTTMQLSQYCTAIDEMKSLQCQVVNNESVLLYARKQENVENDKYEDIKKRDQITPLELKIVKLNEDPKKFELDTYGIDSSGAVILEVPGYEIFINDLFDTIDNRKSTIELRGKTLFIVEKKKVDPIYEAYLKVRFILTSKRT